MKDGFPIKGESETMSCLIVFLPATEMKKGIFKKPRSLGFDHQWTGNYGFDRSEMGFPVDFPIELPDIRHNGDLIAFNQVYIHIILNALYYIYIYIIILYNYIYYIIILYFIYIYIKYI